MLKKLFLTLACLPLALACFAAQLTATLQSGDNLTPFYGDNSFVEAYEAAEDGDIITLSPGNFNGVDTIAKSIKVIGSYAFDEKASVATIFSNSPTINASDVFVEGIRFTNPNWGVNIKSTDHLTFSRCYINFLRDEKDDSVPYHTNTRLVDCQVNLFNAMEFSDNLVLQNCCIEYFGDLNEKAKLAYIENCMIRYWYNDEKKGWSQPYAIYKNCYLGCWSFNTNSNLVINSPIELHDIFFRNMFWHGTLTINLDNCITSNIVRSNHKDTSSYYCMPGLSFKPYVYEDVSYGPIDHKDYPAIPVVTSSEIDSKTDAEGNLHVKINAEVRD